MATVDDLETARQFAEEHLYPGTHESIVTRSLYPHHVLAREAIAILLAAARLSGVRAGLVEARRLALNHGVCGDYHHASGRCRLGVFAAEIAAVDPAKLVAPPEMRR